MHTNQIVFIRVHSCLFAVDQSGSYFPNHERTRMHANQIVFDFASIRVYSRFQKKSSRKTEIWSLINTDETSGYFAVDGD